MVSEVDEDHKIQNHNNYKRNRSDSGDSLNRP
jgi:hypothetical protein